jgi:hypothetical protein
MMAGTGTSVSPEEAARITGTGTSTGDPNQAGNPGANSDGTAGSAATQNATSALGMNTAAASALSAGPGLTSVPSSAQNAMNILQGLYSGNEASILKSVGSMATNMGAGSMMQQYLNQAPGQFNSYDAPSNVTNTPGGKGTTNNNVSINVSVPDATSGSAFTFAQLVKGYLDDSSLMSNTGGN